VLRAVVLRAVVRRAVVRRAVVFFGAARRAAVRVVPAPVRDRVDLVVVFLRAFAVLGIRASSTDRRLSLGGYPRTDGA
jgi:hypothetical protein